MPKRGEPILLAGNVPDIGADFYRRLERLEVDPTILEDLTLDDLDDISGTGTPLDPFSETPPGGTLPNTIAELRVLAENSLDETV